MYAHFISIISQSRCFIASDEVIFSTHLRDYIITLQTNALNADTRYSLLLTFKYDIPQQTNAFITSDELVSDHLQIQYHTAELHVSNAFRAGDEH